MQSQLLKVEPDEGLSVLVPAAPDKANLLELPPEKATFAKFPPGLCVLYTDISSSPLVVLRGQVELVYIDLSPNISSKCYFYKISLESETDSTIAGEYQLQWAPGSSIWMKSFRSDSGLEWKPATVVGSYHDVEMVPKYSVQVVGTGGGLFHGVAGDCTRYRQLGAAIAPSEKCDASDNGDVLGDMPQGLPPFESPTSTVQPFFGSRMSRTPSPTSQVQSTDLSTDRSNVGEAKATGQKRSSSPTEELVAIADENGEIPPSKKSRVVDSYPQVETNRHNKGQVREAYGPGTSLALERVSEKGTKHSNSKLFSATKQVQMPDFDDREVSTMQIKVPDFANPIRVRDALMGDCGQNHERLLRETGARDIELRGHSLKTLKMEVVVTIDLSKMQAAQELIEDVIANTVSFDERPRMLFYLSAENGYGASEGLARYQRSPRRNGEWTWMAVIETPSSFPKHVALFVGKHGEGIRSIVSQTGCDFIFVSNSSIYKYVFVCAREAKIANSAASLIADRVQWVDKNGEWKRCNERRR